jgi:hypothetical protein
MSPCCQQIYAPEHALKGGHLYDNWDPDLAQALVDGMTPRAARLDLQTRAFDALTERIQQVGLPVQLTLQPQSLQTAQ